MARGAREARALPFEPLQHYLSVKYRHPPLQVVTEVDGGVRPSDARMAWLCGLDRGQIQRDRVRNAIDLTLADRVAIKLDLHPFDIWGDDYFAVPISKGLLYTKLKTKAAARSADDPSMCA